MPIPSRETAKIVLDTVAEMDNKFCTSEVADEVKFTPSTVRRVLNVMREPAWIVRRNNGGRTFYEKFSDIPSSGQFYDLFLEHFPKRNPYWWRGADVDTGYGNLDYWLRQRVLCKERDGYECRMCGRSEEKERQESGRGLSVHHIAPRREFDISRGDTYVRCHTLSNLATLCGSCHLTVEHNPEEYPNYHSSPEKVEVETTSAIDW